MAWNLDFINKDDFTKHVKKHEECRYYAIVRCPMLFF